jgi:hypothetical protein
MTAAQSSIRARVARDPHDDMVWTAWVYPSTMDPAFDVMTFRDQDSAVRWAHNAVATHRAAVPA